MLAAALLAAVLAAVQQQTPVPQPFPRPGSPQPTTASPAQRPPTTTAPPVAPPATAPAVQSDAVPTEATLGVPIFPNAQFLASYDAGRGQRYYLFGTTGSFVDLVNFYRTVLKQKGDVVFEVPATHEFDIGKFNEDTMAFPPSVTIKDFQSSISAGYQNPKPGAQPARFPTVIQIVPRP